MTVHHKKCLGVMIAIPVFIGCCTVLGSLQYQGDGRFTDSFFLVYNQRYSLVLGHIDTSERSQQEFSVGPMPVTSYDWGLSGKNLRASVIFAGGSRDPVDGLATVRLTIRENPGDKVVYEVNDSLSDWNWELFRQDEAPHSENSMYQSFIFPQTDRFSPTPHTRYTVELEVVTVDQIGLDLQFEARGYHKD